MNPLILGPLNGGFLILSIAFAVATVAWTVLHLNRAQPIPYALLAIALIVPLLFVSWAGTYQHTAAMDWAMSTGPTMARQTQMASMLNRTIATQLWGGVGVALTTLALVTAATGVTVRGERPRWLLGGLALCLVTAMIAVAAASMSSLPPVITGVRVAMYAIAAGVSVAALVSAHRRGPGAQLGILIAFALPLLIVSVDTATLAALASVRLAEIARAVPSERQGLFDTLTILIDTLQAGSWWTLGLATATAALGPWVAWRKERSMAITGVVGLVLVLMVGLAGIGWTTSWMAPFR
ncbi:MAG: hypothetical protein AB8H79_00560 [Myxococcota bacterium]